MAQRLVEDIPDTQVTPIEESQEGREMRGAFIGYVLSREEIDPESPFTREVVRGLDEERARAGQVEGVEFAIDQGAMLGRYGNMLDHQSKREMKDIIDQLINMSPGEALETFQTVVKNMFINENGETDISIGRVIVLLSLCYELIVAYIQKKIGFQKKEIISFILDVGTWLWLVFVKYQLNAWLKRQGGWGDAVAKATNLFSWPGGRSTLLFVGVVSLSLWAITYYWSKD